MPRNGITQEQVLASAQRLATNAQPVTVKAIRDALGAGSFTTIANYLRDWRQQTKLAVVPPTPVPTEIEAAASKAVASLWQAAWELANREIEAIRQASQIQATEAQAHAQEAIQEVARLETQAQSDAQQITAQAQSLETLRNALTAAEIHVAAQQSRAEQLHARTEELKAELAAARALSAQKIEECGRLHGELAARVAPPPKNGKAAPHNSTPA